MLYFSSENNKHKFLISVRVRMKSLYNINVLFTKILIAIQKRDGVYKINVTHIQQNINQC